MKADDTLRLVTHYVSRGLRFPEGKQFLPYTKVRSSLTTDKGTLLLHHRVVVPDALQGRVLAQLHATHSGASRMKALARSYVWWPNIDRQIEESAAGCLECQEQQNAPSKDVRPWTYPAGPWQRIHADFAGPIEGHMYFIIVDAYSKWPEIAKMSSTTSTATIKVLKGLFTRHGLPFNLGNGQWRTVHI